uniref:Importin N-terminal domain-containing protein n=1 Tax=Auxenochlorella protothecoides TaxID=3075 RepID=A0A1D2AEU2_AUXPR
MADQLLQAVHALYQNPDPSVKEQANAWLDAWQQSPEAWAVSDAVLARPDAGLEARYLCAQTLRTKITRDYEELPPSAVPSLRDSLLRMLLATRDGHAATRTQLCLALASLAAHLPADQWAPAGGGVLAWAEAALLSGPVPAWPLAVELAGMLAAEGASFQPSLRPARRRAFLEELLAALPRALGLLGAALGRPGVDAGATLDAFAAWLRLGATNGGVPAPALASAGALVDATLAGLDADGEDDLLYQAVEATVELVYCGAARGAPRPELADLAGRIVSRVMALRPRFHVCCAAARAEAGGGVPGADDDSEEAKALARLFAEVGEAYTELIATGTPQVMGPLEAILDVAAHPSDNIASMSFNFWHRLSRVLTSGLQPQPIGSGGAQEGALAPEESRRRLAVFAPVFERLVGMVRGRVRFPDLFDSWHRDEQADFKRARVGVGDTLIDAATVLGGEAMLRLLAEPLLALSAEVARGAPLDWRGAEAALYCIRAVHRFAPPPGDALLAALFAALPGLPAPPPALAYTVALTIGAYADWLAASAALPGGGGAQVGPLLRLLVAGLGSPEASSAAALSIRRLCEGAAAQLAPELPALLRMFAEIQGSGDVAQNAYEQYDLDEEDVQQLIVGITTVSNTLAPGAQAACLSQLLETLVAPMQAALARAAAATRAGAEPGAESGLGLVVPLMERTTTVFRSSSDRAAVGQALVQLWPTIEAALDRFADDPEATERILRAPRYGLRSAGRAGAGAIPSLLSSFPARFAAGHHPAYLYVISEAIKVFGDEPGYVAVMEPIFAALVAAACARLGSLAAVGASPDLADDTFLLAGRALAYCPGLALTPGTLARLCDAALAGLLVQHREACCSVLAFLARLLDPALAARSGPAAAAALRAAVEPRGAALARLVLAGALGTLAPARLAELGDVLAALLATAGGAGAAWVHGALAALPPQTAEPADRERLAAAATAAAGGGAGEAERRDLHAALAELSDVCRRNRRAQRAAEAALAPPAS